MTFRRLMFVCLGSLVLSTASQAVSRASGDFNGDGFDDLAIAAPNSNGGGFTDVGSITVLYGTSGGLNSTGSQYWDQDSPGIKGTVENTDRFGSSLATGDFDGDGFDDLAIGVVGQTVNLAIEAGAVSVLYGSPAGLTAAGDQLWHRDVAGMNGPAESLDQFGTSLATGDFDGDGFADLAIGIPGATVSALTGAGAVCVLYGSSAGLTASGAQFWNQDSPGVVDSAVMSEFFGSALASGDFDDDGFDDLAAGVPNESGNALHSGAVSVLYGSSTGLNSSGDQLWTQDTPSVRNEAEDDDGFGSTLASGDFDGDGFDDLAVGIRSEDINGFDDAGAVAVLYGSPSGISADRDRFFHQDQSGIPGAAITFGQFGQSLVCADFDNDGFADLAIGAPTQTVDGVIHAGVVIDLYGTANGLGYTGAQQWSRNSPGISGTAAYNDLFGYALAAGDFNGDGFDELAAAAPNAEVAMDDTYTITQVSVVLADFTHTNPDDVDILLVGPTGISVMLMSDVGGDTDVSNLTLFFTDAAVGQAPDTTPLANGDYQPTDLEPGDSFPAPAPAMPTATTLSAFNGTNPHGTWKLYVVDDTGTESGSISYWALQIQTIGTTYSGASITIPTIGQASVYPSDIDVKKVSQAGAVHVLRGSATGIMATGDQVWNRGKSGIAGQPHFDEEFGIVLPN